MLWCLSAWWIIPAVTRDIAGVEICKIETLNVCFDGIIGKILIPIRTIVDDMWRVVNDPVHISKYEYEIRSSQFSRDGIFVLQDTLCLTMFVVVQFPVFSLLTSLCAALQWRHMCVMVPQINVKAGCLFNSLLQITAKHFEAPYYWPYVGNVGLLHEDALLRKTITYHDVTMEWGKSPLCITTKFRMVVYDTIVTRKGYTTTFIGIGRTWPKYATPTSVQTFMK